MKAIPILLGAALLSACATKPVIQRETVEVKVPVLQPLPVALTAPVPKPALPAGAIVNDDLLGLIDAYATALDSANGQLRAIRELQPK